MKAPLSSNPVKAIVIAFIFALTAFGLILATPPACAADTKAGVCKGSSQASCDCECDEGYEVESENCIWGWMGCGGTCTCKKIEPAYTCREECLAAGGDTSECLNLAPCPTESEKIQSCVERCIAAGNDKNECNKTCSSDSNAYPPPPTTEDGETKFNLWELIERKEEIDLGFMTIPTDPKKLAGSVLELGIGLGVLLAVLFIIIGGIGVTTSAGDPKNLAKAKRQITAAVAGLLFLLCSALILNIIGGEIIGIDFFK